MIEVAACKLTVVYRTVSSGLINQSVIAVGIFAVCLTSHALMRRKRRGRGELARRGDALGSVETWEFG